MRIIMKHYLVTVCIAFTILTVLQAAMSVLFYNAHPIQPGSIIGEMIALLVIGSLLFAIDMLFRIRNKLLIAVQYAVSFFVVIVWNLVFENFTFEMSNILPMLLVFSAVFFGTVGINSIKVGNEVKAINRKLNEINKR